MLYKNKHGKKVYKNKQGKKLYPVCRWEENQHKLYNAYVRILNDIDDGKPLYEELDRVQHAMEAFEAYIIGGMVYATYEDSILIKDYIWAYNARH